MLLFYKQTNKPHTKQPIKETNTIQWPANLPLFIVMHNKFNAQFLSPKSVFCYEWEKTSNYSLGPFVLLLEYSDG